MQESLLHCPLGHKYSVVDSRPAVLGGLETMVRRRKCASCGHLTKTIELPEALAKDVLTDD